MTGSGTLTPTSPSGSVLVNGATLVMMLVVMLPSSGSRATAPGSTNSSPGHNCTKLCTQQHRPGDHFG
eukprot:scaffold2981_cov215-Prasinococcus_capsulatus_cf.AAC.2